MNGLLFLLLLLSFVGSTLLGPVSVNVEEAVRGLFSGGPDSDILFRARLPRVLLGMAVGGGLASASLVLQAFLRNPLACAHILGVSGGASLGGILGLIFAPYLFSTAGQQLVGEISWLPLTSFLGALCSMVLIYRLSLVHGRLHPYH
ncbi:MAG: iron chelate uptake ABC transporter family permease subunit, partial [bacterium]